MTKTARTLLLSLWVALSLTLSAAAPGVCAVLCNAKICCPAEKPSCCSSKEPEACSTTSEAGKSCCGKQAQISDELGEKGQPPLLLVADVPAILPVGFEIPPIAVAVRVPERRPHSESLCFEQDVGPSGPRAPPISRV